MLSYDMKTRETTLGMIHKEKSRVLDSEGYDPMREKKNMGDTKSLML